MVFQRQRKHNINLLLVWSWTLWTRLASYRDSRDLTRRWERWTAWDGCRSRSYSDRVWRSLTAGLRDPTSPACVHQLAANHSIHYTVHIAQRARRNSEIKHQTNKRYHPSGGETTYVPHRWPFRSFPMIRRHQRAWQIVRSLWLPIHVH